MSSLVFFAQKNFTFGIIVIASGFLINSILFIFIRSSKQRLLTLTKKRTKVQVFRDNEIKTIDSVELVPGDIMYIKSGLDLPCDSIQIKGECLINESNLTGETVPVSKYEIKESENLFSIKEH